MSIDSRLVEPSDRQAWDAANARLLARLADCTGAERIRLERLLIRLHTPLARDIARCYGGLGEQPGRALRVAMAGLSCAVRTFDPKGHKDFPAYATSVIQLELSRELAGNGAGVPPAGAH